MRSETNLDRSYSYELGMPAVSHEKGTWKRFILSRHPVFQGVQRLDGFINNTSNIQSTLDFAEQVWSVYTDNISYGRVSVAFTARLRTYTDHLQGPY